MWAGHFGRTRRFKSPSGCGPAIRPNLSRRKSTCTFATKDPAPLFSCCTAARARRRRVDPLIDTLTRSHRVLVANLAGYGRSRALDGEYTLARVHALLEDDLLARGVRISPWWATRRARTARWRWRSRRACRCSLRSGAAGFAGVDAAEAGRLPRVRAGPPRTRRRAAIWLARMAGPDLAQRHPDAVADVMSWLDCVPHKALAAELDAFADAADLRLRELHPGARARR